METLTSGPPTAQIYLTLYQGVWWSNKFQYCPEVALIWSCFLFVAVCLSLVRWCNPMNSLAILPIASGLPKLQNPVAIVWIANIEVSIAGGLRQPERALFGDCRAPRGLHRIPEHASGPALQSGLRPDGQPLG